MSTTVQSTITDRRRLEIKRAGGTVEWTLDEFDYGRSYLLTTYVGGTTFQAHFDREQWRSFQALLAKGYEEER